jgi:hypothetical protein
MSVDHYFAKIDDRWKLIDPRVTDGRSEYIPPEEWGVPCTEFWVDICHGGQFLIDERYYFTNFTSALEFYLEGWKTRQFLNDDGSGVGLDHSGLYSQGRLIHGHDIYGDAPGHEGETLRRICQAIARKNARAVPITDESFQQTCPLSGKPLPRRMVLMTRTRNGPETRP